jgi:hypothetical protein
MNTTLPIVVLDNEFATLWYHPDTKIVHHEFHKFVYGDAFREVLLAGAETLKAHGSVKWLSDDRLNSAIRDKDMEWGRANWFPMVRAFGWKYWAIVQPQNTLGQLNMKREAEIKIEQGVTVALFDNPDEAMAWLIRQ